MVSEQMNVRRVAELAKLSITDAEEARLSAEMEEILRFARQIQQLDVAEVPQTQHIADRRNGMRADEVRPGMLQEEVLAAAPSRVDVYIPVPRTVE